MNVFKRFSDIVSSNINSALDKMEDPKKMIALMIDQMEETAIDLRASIAEKSAALATLERQCAETGDSIARWSGRARLALEKGREDLAREAIAEKKALESHPGAACTGRGQTRGDEDQKKRSCGPRRGGQGEKAHQPDPQGGGRQRLRTPLRGAPGKDRGLPHRSPQGRHSRTWRRTRP